jgi:hypothetical protein
MPNVELLQKTMQFIKDNPDKHDQSTWINECGTTACFAGWACMLSGDQLDRNATRSWVVGQQPRVIRNVARQHLELDGSDADCLFSASNTVEELEFMVKELSNGNHLEIF